MTYSAKSGKRGFLLAPAEEHIHGVESKTVSRKGNELGMQTFRLDSIAPLSRFSESIRSIKLALDSNYTSLERCKNAGFTSALPGEGKSTVAAALSLYVAKTGAKTILLDLDLRNPRLTRLLAESSKNDVVGVLLGTCELRDAIWVEPNSNLAFLPAPTKILVANSAELLSSIQLKQLFEELCKQYDYVIVDLPPLSPLVDTRATGNLIANYFMIVEWGKTSIDVVQHSLAISPNIDKSTIGVVLNKVDFRQMRKYDASVELSYINADFRRYGFTG